MTKKQKKDEKECYERRKRRIRMNKKRELSNPARFWVGVSMIFFEVLFAGIFGLTLLDWSWLTEKVLLIAFSISGMVLYNVLAGILLFNGSSKSK